jgi:hypothetical protein
MIFLLTSCGCEKLMQNMYDQPKYEPLEASPLFANGMASRPLVRGTIAHSSGAFADTSSGRIGEPKVIGLENTGPLLPTEVQAQGQTVSSGKMPFPITMRVLKRGQQRFNIYCSPCHSQAGDGYGMVVMHGFPPPPSYHTDALRHAPLSHFYDVITQGYGIMYSYADRVPPHDRWAIAAYIRALQLNQHAPLADLTKESRSKLQHAKP